MKLLMRYIVATFGLLLVALGISLSVVSNLGTSALSCPPYVLSLKFGLTLGEFTVIVNTCLILIQLAVLRGRFKVKYLLQILASVVFGYMIDMWNLVVAFIVPSSLLVRFLYILSGCVITAFGVSIEVAAEAWMLSAEMTVYAFTKVIDKPFGTLKIWMDCIWVVLAAILSFVFFGNPLGQGEFTSLWDCLLARTPGMVIGLGTIILAILPGYLMKFTDPFVGDTLRRRFSAATGSGKWRTTVSGK